MNKIRIPKVDFPMGPFPFPLCFDMTLALLLAANGLDYRACFSECYAAEFHEENDVLEEIFVFPCYGWIKYGRAGIAIRKQKTTSAEEIVSVLKEQLSQGNPVALHFDGYNCPWDKNLYRKEHNDHTVLVTGISRRGKFLKVCDRLFCKYQRTVRTKRVIQNCRFYYRINVPKALQRDVTRSPRSCLESFYRALLKFLTYAEKTPDILALEKKDPVETKLFSLLQRGRVCHHFYSLYLDFLVAHGGADWKPLCQKLHEAQYAWGDSLFYLLKSCEEHRYCTDDMMRYLKGLAECYRAMIFDPEENKP